MVQVDSVGGTYVAACRFIECLTTLPNLHTLEIALMWRYQFFADHFVDALKKRKPRFQQLRALVLPDKAHWLLRCCPNVEDLTCYGVTPDEAFAESLVAGELTRIAGLSILCRAVSLGADPWPGGVYFFPHYRKGKLTRILTEIARACPGIQELCVVHVSLNPVPPFLCVTDINIFHVPGHPFTK